MSTVTDDRTQLGPPDTEEGKVAHIVKTQPGESAVAKVMEARIYGYAVEALCGKTFVPSRDPKQVPPCEPCKEIYDLFRIENEHLNEGPAHA